MPYTVEFTLNQTKQRGIITQLTETQAQVQTPDGAVVWVKRDYNLKFIQGAEQPAPKQSPMLTLIEQAERITDSLWSQGRVLLRNIKADMLPEVTESDVYGYWESVTHINPTARFSWMRHIDSTAPFLEEVFVTDLYRRDTLSDT